MTASAQIVVTALVKVRPEARDEALAALTAGIETTHGEDGCVAYALHEDTAQEAHFVIVEKRATREALEAHRQAEHLKAMGGAVGPRGGARRLGGGGAGRGRGVAYPRAVVFTRPLPVGDDSKATI